MNISEFAVTAVVATVTVVAAAAMLTRPAAAAVQVPPEDAQFELVVKRFPVIVAPVTLLLVLTAPDALTVN